jgi:hypothetical protein
VKATTKGQYSGFLIQRREKSDDSDYVPHPSDPRSEGKSINPGFSTIGRFDEFEKKRGAKKKC